MTDAQELPASHRPSLGPQVKTLSEMSEWHKESPVFILDLSETTGDNHHFRYGIHTMHSNIIERFDKCFVYGRDIIASLDGGGFSIRSRNVDVTASTVHLEHVASERFAETDIATSIRSDMHTFYLRKSLLEDAIILDDPVLLMTPAEHCNFGAWLFSALFCYKVFREHLDGRRHYVLAAMHSPWQKKMLLGIGFRSEELLNQRLDKVYAGEVLLQRYSHHDYAVSNFEKEAFVSFANWARVISSLRSDDFRKIYISRKAVTSAGAHRGLINEVELIEALVAEGFAIVEPEKLSIFDQALIFSSANLIVALGGAATFNAVFCQSDAMLIDIESNFEYIHQHSNIFASSGISYGFIIGAVDEKDPAPYQRRWCLDVHQAVAAIRKYT